MDITSRFLSQSRVNLNNPGTQKSDIYYNKQNTEVDMLECTYTNGRFKQSLSNANFGSSGAVNIPNQSLLSTTLLQVELPPILVANMCLLRGWLFRLINRVDYVFGGANVGNLSLNGESIFQIIMGQCETEEKRSEMLRLAGELVIGAQTADDRNVAQLILPLPFSTACSMFMKKPYDTTLLNSPIQINVYFNPASTIYGGSNAAANYPLSFNSAKIFCRQGQLSNPGQGLRPIIKSDPNLSYIYPMIHKQSFETSVSGSTGNLSFLLEQFIYADLLGISIGIIEEDKINPSAAADPRNPFDYEDLEDVIIKFNGNVIYDAERNLSELVDLDSSIGAGYVQNARITGTGPFVTEAVDTHIFHMDFSRMRSECFDGKFFNTMRIGQQTLSFECTLPRNTGVATNYRVFATYYYNGIIQTDSSGTAQIYFD